MLESSSSYPATIPEKPASFNSEWTNERIIAEDLANLSCREREEAYEDVHGVSDQVKETPGLIESSLKHLDDQLMLLDDKQAYDLAESLSKDFVTDQRLRLKFLRATQFDPARAASRMEEFFRVKLDLFGKEKLVKKITFEDLGEDSMEAISQGMMQQVLPSRDTQGRAVVCGSQRLFLSQVERYKDPIRTLVKAFWYVTISVADDEETQKKGFVYITYTVDFNQPTDAIRREILQYCGVISRSIPARVAAVHHCSSSLSSAALWRAAILAMETNLRVRVRTHSGSHSEVQYSLMSFGIPVNDFPFLEKREVKKSNHLKWIERRKRKEEYLKTNTVPKNAVDIPSRKDVILGRGTPFNCHPGNKRLHEMVADHYDEYDSEMRVGKTKLAERILKMIHGYGGKFLKLDDECGMWKEVSLLDARNKVAHGFRRRREFTTKSAKATPVKQMVIGEGYGEHQNKRLRVPYEPSMVLSDTIYR